LEGGREVAGNTLIEIELCSVRHTLRVSPIRDRAGFRAARTMEPSPRIGRLPDEFERRFS
jgi:hypothetical protein